jgi:LPS O-antigen subunit length determinant protein (WzzB/FepE family)
MNDTNRNHYDDEIDLFEIVEILWQGKWIIVASVFIALAASYAYLMNKEVVYEYNLPYSSITAPDAGAFRHFLTLSDVPFSLNEKSKTLSLTSTNSNYEPVISSEAAIIGNKLTQFLIDEADKEADEEADEANFILKLIKEDIPVQILNSEEAAKRYFKAKLVLQKITYSVSAIEFQSVVKTVKSRKVTLVLALSVVVGGMAGLFFIFLLRMVAAYKKRQEAAI